MKTLRCSVVRCLILPIVFLSASFLCHAAGGEFYRRFAQSYATNHAVTQLIKDVTLMDTNNTSRKLTNAVFNLGDLTNGVLGRIRLGMTMDEVVNEWGKPIRLYGQCGSGHRFDYKDCWLRFSSNCLFSIFLSEFAPIAVNPQLESIQAWTNILAAPAKVMNSDAVFETRGKRHTAMLLSLRGKPHPRLFYLDPVFSNTTPFVKSAWQLPPLTVCVTTNSPAPR